MNMEKTLDSILDSMPISYFHFRLILICGLSFMADAMEVSLLSFTSTCAGEEWNLSYHEKATITGVVFIGELIGSLFWGFIADKYGRKVAFIFCGLLISGGGFLSASSMTYQQLLLFQFVVGSGVGGIHVPFDLLAEFLPSNKRGKYLNFIQYFWTIGSLLVAGLAWATLTTHGWRFLTLMTAIPVTISSIACFVYLPESPRWLLTKGKTVEAKHILLCVAASNGTFLEPFTLVTELNASTSSKEKQVNILDLIKTKESRWISCPLWAVWGLFGLSYYGIILLVSRMYTSVRVGDGGACAFDYQAIFINSSAEIVGVFLSSAMVDSLGRRPTQVLLYSLGGAAVALMCAPLSFSAGACTGFVARLAVMGASCATWVVTPELYPTEMRATAHSVCNSACRVGAFCSPYLVFSAAPVLAVGLALGAANLLAAAASALLPETCGRALDRRQPR